MKLKKKIKPIFPEYDANRVIERPDGFYWQSKDGHEYGPFESLVAAIADMDLVDDESLEAGETLEAEADIGIAEWIDAETGELAEEGQVRIEEH